MLHCMYYDFDPANFFSTPGLAWLVCLKLKRAKLVLLYDIDVVDGHKKNPEVEYVTQFLNMQRQIMNHHLIH